MRPISRTAVLVLTMISLAACKFVKTEAGPAEGGQAATQAAEADQITQLVDASFADQLLPMIEKTALPVADLRTAVAASLDAAGQAHGNRGAGEGAAWNFAVVGQGTVIAANLTSRARKAEVDTTGDGIADVTLLLGPVITGTSLRDVAPFYRFGDFKDQISFAQLARALNDKISPTLIIPQGDITGMHLSFTGVVPLKTAADRFVVTAVSVKVDP